MTDCGHVHDRGTNVRRLIAAFVVIFVFMVVEVIGGLLTGSLALLADAAHMLTDAMALGLAAGAQWFSARPPDRRRHFGYQRLQVLAAFVNAIALFAIIAWIVAEAVRRFVTPNPVDWAPMLVIALAGLAANGVAFRLLHGAGDRNVNVRGAMLHVVSDMLGSVAAVVAALVIMATGWARVDPLLSLVVAALIFRSALSLARETAHILLEGAPAGIDVGELAADLKAVSGAEDIHDIHIWQLTPDTPRITFHARFESAETGAASLAAIKARLADRYGIRESTIQIETAASSHDCGLRGAPVSEAVRDAATTVLSRVSDAAPRRHEGDASCSHDHGDHAHHHRRRDADEARPCGGPVLAEKQA